MNKSEVVKFILERTTIKKAIRLILNLLLMIFAATVIIAGRGRSGRRSE